MVMSLLNGYVASFTDAWIETIRDQANVRLSRVASFTDAWIETRLMPFETRRIVVASFTDVWVETSIRLISQTAQGVRPLRI